MYAWPRTDLHSKTYKTTILGEPLWEHAVVEPCNGTGSVASLAGRWTKRLDDHSLVHACLDSDGAKLEGLRTVADASSTGSCKTLHVVTVASLQKGQTKEDTHRSGFGGSSLDRVARGSVAEQCCARHQEEAFEEVPTVCFFISRCVFGCVTSA